MNMIKLSDGRKVSEYEAKLTIFNAYMKMHEMLGVPVKQKAMAFRGIVDMVPGWKVVGITAAALEIFKKLDYISPMAVPLVMQISKESTVWSELTDDILAHNEEEIICAARVQSLH